jgi:transcriptional regulator with XRE-family HTH domain
MPESTAPDLAPFAARLRALRARRGISQRWLAREAGISYGAVGHLEMGRCGPTAENLARLADVFGVSMDELWHGNGRCEGVGAGPDERIGLSRVVEF